MNNRMPGSSSDFERNDSQLFESLEGKLLVAAPNWEDEDFQHSVCLVVHHGQDGAVGILLNRHFDLDAKELWQHLSEGKFELPADMLHLGGPQSGPVVALHGCDSLAEFETAEGVYMAAEIENLKSLLQSALGDSSAESGLKIIVGQADWEAGELEGQMQMGAWLPIEPSAEIVFEEQAWMWRKAMAHIGNSFVREITGALPTKNCLLN
ncbi:MAG: YqgE/AlgH family protein [Planctomycetota bacterium]